MTQLWHWLLDQEIWQIAVAFTVIPILTGTAVYLLGARGGAARYMARQGPLAPAYLTSITVVFSLFAAFMLGDIWEREGRIQTIVSQEAHRLHVLVDLAVVCGRPCDPVVEAARGYATALSTHEWASEWTELSPEAGSALDHLLATVEDPDTAPMRGVVLEAYTELRQLRNDRFALLYYDLSPHRWVMLVVLGVLTQMALATLHPNRPGALAIVLALFTATFIAIVVYMVVVAWPNADESILSPEIVRVILR